jgi:hypothetical protein
VRDDCQRMSDPASSDPENRNSQADLPNAGILSALPRARPQRASPRRASTRSKADKAPRTAHSKESKAPTVATAGKPKTTRATSAEVASTKAAAPGVRVGQAKTKSTPRAPKTKLAPTRQAEPPAPRQGYEPEEEVELGTTVNPPSSVELVESVADIAVELANSGLAAGGRLLKDAFSLLRRP